MGDIRQVKYAEERKLAEKQQAEATAPSLYRGGFFHRLANQGVPVNAAAIIGEQFVELLERIRALEARLEFLEHHSG